MAFSERTSDISPPLEPRLGKVGPEARATVVDVAWKSPAGPQALRDPYAPTPPSQWKPDARAGYSAAMEMKEARHMVDVVYLVAGVAIFGLFALYTRALGRL